MNYTCTYLFKYWNISYLYLYIFIYLYIYIFIYTFIYYIYIYLYIYIFIYWFINLGACGWKKSKRSEFQVGPLGTLAAPLGDLWFPFRCLWAPFGWYLSLLFRNMFWIVFEWIIRSFWEQFCHHFVFFFFWISFWN